MRKGHRWLSVVLSLAILIPSVAAHAADTDLVRVGVIADVHAHDADSPAEGKVMTNYAERLDAFAAAMDTWSADAVLQLGDLVNGNFVLGAVGDPARIPGILADALPHLTAFDGPIYHVAGNHDFYDLSLDEYLAGIQIETAIYSFDLGGFHFAVLDAEYEPDGSHYDHVFMRVKGHIHPDQLEWLRADLAATGLPTIVLIHQPLDSDFDALAGGPPVANNLEVQGVLADSGVVIAVFQGHDHENRYAEIDGIHYITFAAMVDHTEPTPPTYAQVTLDPEGRTIRIDGFGLQESYELSYDL
jgi:3',5'-cyclic AMP phosphodiesterase CpdA